MTAEVLERRRQWCRQRRGQLARRRRTAFGERDERLLDHLIGGEGMAEEPVPLVTTKLWPARAFSNASTWCW